MGILIGLLIIAGLGAFIIYSNLQKRKAEEAMAAFAMQQGWTALPNDNSLLGYLPQYLVKAEQNGSFGSGIGLGLVFGASGNSVQVSFDMAYQATINEVTMVFFQYTCTEYWQERDPRTGMEETHSKTSVYNIVNAKLNKAQPNILLLHHSFLSKIANFGEHSNMQKLQLEGNFNKSYDTYIVPHGEVDTLTLLTPDLMSLLVDIKDASVQFDGKSVIVSIPTGNMSPQTIMPVLNSAVSIAREADNLPDIKPAPASPTEPATPAATAA